MFEWVCQHCAAQAQAEAAATAPSATGTRRARPRSKFGWADVDRGFRFGLGFLAALAVGYFLLFGAAWAWDNPDWMERLTRWMRMR